MRSERLGVLRLAAHPSIDDTAEAHLFNPLGALRGDVMVDAERRDADKKPGKELQQRPGKTGKFHFRTCRFVTSSIISLASPSPDPPDSCRIAPHAITTTAAAVLYVSLSAVHLLPLKKEKLAR